MKGNLWPYPDDGGPLVFSLCAFAPRPAVVVRAELAMFVLAAPPWAGNGPEGTELARRWAKTKQELMVIEAWEKAEAR